MALIMHDRDFDENATNPFIRTVTIPELLRRILGPIFEDGDAFALRRICKELNLILEPQLRLFKNPDDETYLDLAHCTAGTVEDFFWSRGAFDAIIRFLRALPFFLYPDFFTYGRFDDPFDNAIMTLSGRITDRQICYLFYDGGQYYCDIDRCNDGFDAGLDFERDFDFDAMLAKASKVRFCEHDLKEARAALANTGCETYEEGAYRRRVKRRRKRDLSPERSAKNPRLGSLVLE